MAVSRSHGNMIQRARWALTGATDPQAAAVYRDSLVGIYDSRPLVADTEFYHVSDVAHLGGPILAQVRCNAQQNSRSRTDVRRSGIDHVQMIFQRKGDHYFSRDGREAVCAAGSVRFVDLGHPFEAVQQDYEILDLIVPREQVQGLLPERDLHGMVLNGDRPATRLLTAHLATLWAELDTLTYEEARAAAEAALLLASGAVFGQARIETPYRASVERTLMAQAKAFVDAHLGDRALTPEALGAHLGLSHRSLYRLFAPVGGVAAFIQGRRLDQAFHAVIAMRSEGRVTLGMIAFAHGFGSDAHFSRAFKARFGINARELRGIGMRSDAPTWHRDTGLALMMGWLHSL